MRSPLVVLSALACPVLAAAAPVDIDPVAAARAHVVPHPSSLPPGLTVQVKTETPWKAGSFVRFQQQVAGIPVEGGQVVVNLDSQGHVRRTSGALVSDTDLHPNPTVAASAAAQTADALVERIFGQGELWSSRAELRVWVDHDQRARLVWAVDSSVAEPVGTYRLLVDAHTGEVVNLRSTLHHARASVYPTNPETSELELVDLQRLDEGTTVLAGEHGEVVSCATWVGQQTRCTEKVTLAFADEAGDFIFEPDPTSADDPFAEAQMYYHLDKVGQYFAEKHGFRHAEPIEALVNFDFNNAFFGDADGDGVGEIAFGQNARADFGYDGDVVYHEFVHSVFDSLTDGGLFGADSYGIDYASGSLNEGSADLFGLVMTGDPQLGEYVGLGLGLNGPVRDLEPDLRCPDNLFGQSHQDGQIWGSMGWNMIDDERVGADVVGDLIYGVLQSFGSEITWEVAGTTLVEVAGDLRDEGAIDQGTYDAILEHAAAAGMPGCERIVPLDEGATSTQLALVLDLSQLGDVEHVPLSAQFSVDAPPGTTEIRFNIDQWQTNEPNMVWTVFVRRGDYIEHDVQTVAFFQFPVPATYDFKVDGTGTGTVVVDASSEVPLEAGARYHFSIGARADGALSGFFGQGLVVTSAEIDVGKLPDEPLPEDDTPEDTPRACACSQGGLGGVGAVLPLLALVGLRRRR